jgi:hypothetical protein
LPYTLQTKQERTSVFLKKNSFFEHSLVRQFSRKILSDERRLSSAFGKSWSMPAICANPLSNSMPIILLSSKSDQLAGTYLLIFISAQKALVFTAVFFVQMLRSHLPENCYNPSFHSLPHL